MGFATSKAWLFSFICVIFQRFEHGNFRVIFRLNRICDSWWTIIANIVRIFDGNEWRIDRKREFLVFERDIRTELHQNHAPVLRCAALKACLGVSGKGKRFSGDIHPVILLFFGVLDQLFKPDLFFANIGHTAGVVGFLNFFARSHVYEAVDSFQAFLILRVDIAHGEIPAERMFFGCIRGSFQA